MYMLKQSLPIVIVKEISDINYIPVKYGVIDMKVTGSLDGTIINYMTMRVGWDTKEHYEAWTSQRISDGSIGRVGEFFAGKMSDIEFYYQPRGDGGWIYTPSFDQ
jgi:hypothetical protein